MSDTCVMTQRWTALRDRPELAELLAKAQAKFDAMTLEQQAHHRELQRRSWVRGEMMLEHPEMTEKAVNELMNRAMGPIPSPPHQTETGGDEA